MTQDLYSERFGMIQDDSGCELFFSPAVIAQRLEVLALLGHLKGSFSQVEHSAFMDSGYPMITSWILPLCALALGVLDSSLPRSERIPTRYERTMTPQTFYSERFATIPDG
jgi:hypothetical protein